MSGPEKVILDGIATLVYALGANAASTRYCFRVLRRFLADGEVLEPQAEGRSTYDRAALLHRQADHLR